MIRQLKLLTSVITSNEVMKPCF